MKTEEKKIFLILNFKFLIEGTVVLILIISVSLMANKWRNNVEYDKVSISGNYTISNEEILKYASLSKDSINLEEVNVKFIQDRIAKNPEIKKVFVSKEPPNELKIEIIEKTPLAILNTGNDLKLVDEELEIFPYKNFDKLLDLPVISGIKTESNQSIVSGANKENLFLAVSIILSAYKQGKNVQNIISEINMSDTVKVLVYSNEKSIPFYFPLNKVRNGIDSEFTKKISGKIEIMKNFLEQIESKSILNNAEYVDLRFSEQAIVKFH